MRLHQTRGGISFVTPPSLPACLVLPNVLETLIFSQIYDSEYRTRTRVKAGWAHTNSGCEWNSVGDPNSRIHSSAGAHAEMRVRSAEDDVGSEAGAHPIIYSIAWPCTVLCTREREQKRRTSARCPQSVGVLRAALRVQCWSRRCGGPSQATPPTTTTQQRRQGATVRRANQQDQCLTPTRCRAVRCPAVRATADVAVPAGSARERPLRLLFHGVCGPGRARGARRVGVGGCV